MHRTAQILRTLPLRTASIIRAAPRTPTPLSRELTLPRFQPIRTPFATSRRWNSSNAPTVEGDSPPAIEPRLSMTMTCTANECGHRSTHEFTKRSYQKGIVIIQCPSCKNRHLIADHLGWFKESTGDGAHRTIEQLLASRGEKVRRGKKYDDGTIEVVADDVD